MLSEIRRFLVQFLRGYRVSLVRCRCIEEQRLCLPEEILLRLKVVLAVFLDPCLVLCQFGLLRSLSAVFLCCLIHMNYFISEYRILVSLGRRFEDLLVPLAIRLAT